MVKLPNQYNGNVPRQIADRCSFDWHHARVVVVDAWSRAPVRRRLRSNQLTFKQPADFTADFLPSFCDGGRTYRKSTRNGVVISIISE